MDRGPWRVRLGASSVERRIGTAGLAMGRPRVWLCGSMVPHWHGPLPQGEGHSHPLGWAGAGGSWGWRRPCGKRDDGLAGDGNGTEGGAAAGAGAGSGIGRTPLALVRERESGEIAAVVDESEAQFVPCRTIHLPRHDAKIEADLDEDGADRAAAVLGEDFLGRGQAGEARSLGRGWPAWRRAACVGTAGGWPWASGPGRGRRAG